MGTWDVNVHNGEFALRFSWGTADREDLVAVAVSPDGTTGSVVKPSLAESVGEVEANSLGYKPSDRTVGLIGVSTSGSSQAFDVTARVSISEVLIEDVFEYLRGRTKPNDPAREEVERLLAALRGTASTSSGSQATQAAAQATQQQAPAAPIPGNPYMEYHVGTTKKRYYMTKASLPGGKVVYDTDHLWELREWTRKHHLTSAQHVLLAGPAGTGKSSCVRAVFGSVRGMAFNSNTEEWRLLGDEKYVTDSAGNLKRKILMGELLKAFTHHCGDDASPDDPCLGDPCGRAVFVAEELNVGPPELLTLLHPFLDGTGQVEYLGKVYEQSPDFYFVATANLDALGGVFADPLWSRLSERIEFVPSTKAARAAGIRTELCDFTDQILGLRARGDRTVQIPAMRDLISAHAAWEMAGEAAGWARLVSSARGSSLSKWVDELRDGPTTSEVVDWIESGTTEGRVNFQ